MIFPEFINLLNNIQDVENELYINYAVSKWAQLVLPQTHCITFSRKMGRNTPGVRQNMYF